MKFIIFGTGRFYLNRKNELEKICNTGEIVFFFDNNVVDIGEFEGKKISRPYLVSKESFNKIILMSKSSKEMKEQLLSIGYSDSDIWTWNDFISEMSHGKFELYCGSDRKKGHYRKILMLTYNLGYHGGSVAIVNAAKCLSDDNEVLVAAPVGNISFIQEIQREGINVLIFKAFPHIGKEESYLFTGFDVAIVNVFPMLPIAVRLCKYMPVLWWIHEAKEWYEPTIEEFGDLVHKELFTDMNIMAVSNIAKYNFNQYFGNVIQNTMAYGIPDYYCYYNDFKGERNKLIFAIVGAVCYRKAQDIFVKAIEILQKRDKILNIEFWIIGLIDDNSFCNEIIESSKKIDNIVIKGQMTREQVREAYVDIDVVVCPSREDPLPIVMTEGMMFGKICIASNGTGTCSYIEDKINGLKCEKDDPESLADAMEWVIDNTCECMNIGINARKTYENYFTMEKFTERLNQSIKDTVARSSEKWKK